MAKFLVDFSGYCEVEAETPEEAEEKFWNGIQRPSTACENDIYDIESIKEVKEEEEW